MSCLCMRCVNSEYLLKVSINVFHSIMKNMLCLFSVCVSRLKQKKTTYKPQKEIHSYPIVKSSKFMMLIAKACV